MLRRFKARIRWPNIFLVEVLGRGNRLEWYHRIPWKKEDLKSNQQEKTLSTEELQLSWKQASPQQKLRPDANEIKCFIAHNRHSEISKEILLYLSVDCFLMNWMSFIFYTNIFVFWLGAITVCIFLCFNTSFIQSNLNFNWSWVKP